MPAFKTLPQHSTARCRRCINARKEVSDKKVVQLLTLAHRVAVYLQNPRADKRCRSRRTRARGHACARGHVCLTGPGCREGPAPPSAQQPGEAAGARAHAAHMRTRRGAGGAALCLPGTWAVARCPPLAAKLPLSLTPALSGPSRGLRLSSYPSKT